jgi:hypothetical protein
MSNDNGYPRSAPGVAGSSRPKIMCLQLSYLDHLPTCPLHTSRGLDDRVMIEKRCPIAGRPKYMAGTSTITTPVAHVVLVFASRSF